MHALRPFTIEVGSETLAADRLEVDGLAHCLVLHGAGTGDRSRWHSLRQALAGHGLGSVAIDFSGHGESSHRTPGSLAKRYSEALAALEYLDNLAPRSVIGISMSGEIAVRLGTQPQNRLDRIVTIVGAAYDEAAFDVPFGPSFTRILRTPESWRRSVVFAAIRHYRGRITIVQAERDTVVPAEIGRQLLQNASCAAQANLIRLQGVDHALTSAMRADPRLLDEVARIVQQAVAPH